MKLTGIFLLVFFLGLIVNCDKKQLSPEEQTYLEKVQALRIEAEAKKIDAEARRKQAAADSLKALAEFTKQDGESQMKKINAKSAADTASARDMSGMLTLLAFVCLAGLVIAVFIIAMKKQHQQMVGTNALFLQKQGYTLEELKSVGLLPPIEKIKNQQPTGNSSFKRLPVQDEDGEVIDDLE